LTKKMTANTVHSNIQITFISIREKVHFVFKKKKDHF